MEIKVLGPGCKKCRATKKAIRQVVDDLGLDIQVEEVADISEIMKYDVLTTPGVVIDGKVICSGRIPSRKDIEGWLNG